LSPSNLDEAPLTHTLWNKFLAVGLESNARALVPPELKPAMVTC